jgi:hypothetical protein
LRLPFFFGGVASLRSTAKCGARQGAGKDAGATERGVDYGTLLVALGVVGVWSKPAPLKSTRVRHPRRDAWLLVAMVWCCGGI